MKPPARRSTTAEEAAEELTSYCIAHPGSPTAVRHPTVALRGHVWVALLGENIERGIVGFGRTVAAALRAFDTQYLNALRPPAEAGPVPLQHRYQQRAA
jgi:hypothetical protein